jgi:hypothetical protein
MEDFPFLRDVINVLAEASYMQVASNSCMGCKEISTRDRVILAMECAGDKSVVGTSRL